MAANESENLRELLTGEALTRRLSALQSLLSQSMAEQYDLDIPQTVALTLSESMEMANPTQSTSDRVRTLMRISETLRNDGLNNRCVNALQQALMTDFIPEISWRIVEKLNGSWTVQGQFKLPT